MVMNNSLRAQKLRKLQELKAEGIPAYGYKFERTHTAAEILSQYDYLTTDEIADDEVRICGRVMRQRYSWTFIDLADGSGTVQLYADKTTLDKDSQRRLKLLDRGDLIAVQGRATRTKHGPPSIRIDSWELMSKSLQPLPEETAILNDVEARYRNRHLDLILNPEARDILRKRSLAIRTMRRFLDDRGFLEVETPILHVQAGGAEAKPFVTHHNSLDIDMHLRIAPEFYLRRLLVGGMDKVYEIGKNFRNEGITARHNPEFTSIELFQAYSDYHELMDLTEALLHNIFHEVCGKGTVEYQGIELDFAAPFKRMTMSAAVNATCGIDVDALTSFDDLKKAATEDGVSLTDEDSRGEIINAMFEQKVEQTLIQPTFIMDYPVEVSVCQQLHRQRPGFVERFELFVFGRELANGCSELNDPREQKSRFEAQARKRAKGHEELPAPDVDFLLAMEYGMPPMMGLGIGIDRLVMFLVNAASIRDVIAFPTMKPLPRVTELGNYTVEHEIRDVG
jgi:lysyl-tRNA synthetase, class II